MPLKNIDIEKKEIEMKLLKKIDTTYTNIVKKIIGDIPADQNTASIKESFTNVKNKFLNLGKTDESNISYEDVIKQELLEQKAAQEKAIKIAKMQKEAIKIAKAKSKAYHASKKKTTAKKVNSIKSKVNDKKIITTLKEKSSKKSEKKTNKAKKLSKTEEKIALYSKDIKKHYGEVDEALLTIIVKNLGPSAFNKNAELVSCDDAKELATVRQNFLINKLSIDASKGVLDSAIHDVCEKLSTAKKKMTFKRVQTLF